MKLFFVVLDARAHSSFIVLGELADALKDKLRKSYDIPDVINASSKSRSVVGTNKLIVQIGTSKEAVNFLLAAKFATSVILGCNFCDVHVEEI